MNKKLSKILPAITIMFLLATGRAEAQTMSLDVAIMSTVMNLTGALERGTRVAVLPVASRTTEMTNHLTGGITRELVNMQGFLVTNTADGARFVISGNLTPAVGGNHTLMMQVLDTNTNAILRIHTVTIQNDAQVALLLGTQAQQAARATGGTQRVHFGSRDHYISLSLGFMNGFSFGLNYERMFDRVSWGVDAMGAFGSGFMAFAGAATFRFFPVPIFFLGADLGLSYLGGHRRSSSFGGQFSPQLGFRIGGQNSAFFTDIFFAAPMHIGSGGFGINAHPGTRVGGAW